MIVVDRDSVVLIECGEMKDPQKLRRVRSRGQGVGWLTDGRHIYKVS